MNLQKLSNEELDQNLKSLVVQEREILSEILAHILEVDRRKFFLKMAYASLFDYLTKHLGYSAGSAQRRIDAARLMKDVPELSRKLETGALNLAQVSLVQKAIRQKKRSTLKVQHSVSALKERHSTLNRQYCVSAMNKKDSVSAADKKEILKSLENKSFAESQTLVAKAFDLEIKEHTKVNSQKDESVRVEVTLTKSQWEKLQRMKDLLPSGSGDWSDVLEYLADKVITQKTKARTEPKPASTRINISMRKHVLNRDQCCQYKDRKTGKICGSRKHLQIDHIQPLWAQGKSTSENLQALCSNHNRYRYRQQSGVLQRSPPRG